MHIFLLPTISKKKIFEKFKPYAFVLITETITKCRRWFLAIIGQISEKAIKLIRYHHNDHNLPSRQRKFFHAEY